MASRPLALSFALTACAGSALACAPVVLRSSVERETLATSTLQRLNPSDMILNVSPVLEDAPQGDPGTLSGRIEGSDVCETVERRRIAEVEVFEERVDAEPTLRLIAGGIGAAAALGLGVGAAVADAEGVSKALAGGAIASGGAAAGLFGSVLFDIGRESSTRKPPRIYDAERVIAERPCNRRPGAGLEVKLRLYIRWGKHVEHCDLTAVNTDEEGRFSLPLAPAREAAASPRCLQIDGHPLDQRFLIFDVAEREVELKRPFYRDLSARVLP